MTTSTTAAAEVTAARPRRRGRWIKYGAALIALLLAWVAFVFKDGRGRADYERALPDLVSFYRSVRAVADTDFDPERAARLELEWWIVHRERARHAPGDLDAALAALASEVYRVPAERLAEHAGLRAG